MIQDCLIVRVATVQDLWIVQAIERAIKGAP
jgi:hypothetical protein